MVSSPNGRVAVGWLIVEDLAMVLALVLLPAFAEVLGGKPAQGHGSEHADRLWNWPSPCRRSRPSPPSPS